VVEIAFTAPPEPPYRAGETASLLGVTRSVIAGHGGEARLVVKSGQDPCFEVEFPIAQERVTVAAGPARDPSRRITAMVIEPEEAAQRQLSALLTAQGCRVIRSTTPTPVWNSCNGCVSTWPSARFTLPV